MDTNKENLRVLIEKFMNPQNTQMYLDDIEAGEQILRKHPAPKPDDMLLANIKANIALQRDLQKTVTFKKRVIEAIAVAASIIIIAAVSLRSIDDTPQNNNNNNNYTYTGGIPTPKWSWLEEDKIPAMLDVVDDIDNKFAQVAMDTTDYSYDSFVDYSDKIRELENRLNNVGISEGNYGYTDIYDSGIFDDIENLDNRFNEIEEGYWQEDYSNSDTFDI